MKSLSFSTGLERSPRDSESSVTNRSTGRELQGKSESAQIVAELLRRLKQQGMHAHRFGAFDVLHAVVDEHAITGTESVALEEKPENRRIRLEKAFFPRHDDAIEALQEIEELARLAELVLVPVGDRIDWSLPLHERVQDRDGTGNLARQHLMPALVIGADQRVQLFGIRLDQ